MIYMKFAKIILLINGVVDVLIGISLVFLPNIMAQLLGLPALQIHSLYFAGGWGIAAISFGVARIWAAFVDKFVWYNVILGLFEGKYPNSIFDRCTVSIFWSYFHSC